MKKSSSLKRKKAIDGRVYIPERCCALRQMHLLPLSQDCIGAETDGWPPPQILLDLQLNYALDIPLRSDIALGAGEEVLNGTFDLDLLVDALEGGVRND
jgi:hypothetical protein